MTKYRNELPRILQDTYLSYVGMETDLIFNRGVDLPNFASFPLVETKHGQALLSEYFTWQIKLGASKGLGVILESPTWMANRDRGALIGYTPETVMAANTSAIGLMAAARDGSSGDLPTLLSGQIGPRGDAYAPLDQMTVDEAAAYHMEQINTFADTQADLVSAFTLCYAEEAMGIAIAAKENNMPVAIAFTVETDGRLPTGMELSQAIAMVDEVSGKYPMHYLINCAHPDHFSAMLSGQAWENRLKGLVVNASRCSHAELDEADNLDDGDPAELGKQLGQLKQKYSQLTIFGGCCGTDFRHMTAIADNVSK